ncbi:hypothetical protein ABB37_03879 [Leptomonas pyrrhocoris]|uniref:Uncharacterized protein n=1 Tax=Leptomonas pyrrhocoris TaxID=157538 RepID=A0A0N0DWA4_LEPPY|nr:hypothetical protein ABB37_03879 [Leptomonas pyrrhocoris]KPA81534.1 hypothetical protein ABB37_03879 [Leptomonas pyrrhocoris]|eukprot:XP_015659973.1 hypothetical protein ABB37_03879 [Leptomonas pyrrhocoris]
MNIQISGNLSGPTAIFLAGWPDTCDVFRDNIMATLAADYRVVGITLPGFDDDHPFLQMLREKGMRSSSFGGLRSDNDAHTQSTARSSSGSYWLPTFFPFSYLRRQDEDAHMAQAQHACLVNALRLSCGRPPLEMFRTTWKGHSLEDLVTMLEIAVDTAMETCNYCPTTTPSGAVASGAAASTREKRCPDVTKAFAKAALGVTVNTDDGLDEVPLHQLPPTYTRPVLIAHDWGCVLAYELLLVRPNFFSRIVALDIGAYIYESDAAHVERMCGLMSRSERGGVAPSASFAACGPRAPGTAPPAIPEQTPSTRAGCGSAPISNFSTRDATDDVRGTCLRDMRPRQELKLSAGMTDASHGRQDSSGAATATEAPSSPPLRQEHPHNGNSPPGTPTSSPVTVAHGVLPGAYLGNRQANESVNTTTTTRFDELTASVSNTSQLRNSVSGAATRRSLASRYAIRRKKPTQQTRRAERWKTILIVIYQFFLIICELFLPHQLARWLVGCVASLLGRPTYCYDPQMVFTPTVELLNHTLNTQFFAQHPYALENRGVFEAPVLLQMQEGTSVGSHPGESSCPSTSVEYPSSVRGKLPARLLPGWKILLVPYVEGSPVPVDPTQRTHELTDADGQHCPQFLPSPFSRRSAHIRRAASGGPASGVNGKQRRPRSRMLHTSTHSELSESYSLGSDSATSTDFSEDDISGSLQTGGQQQDEQENCLWNGKYAAAASDASYTIYSSYAKGAGLFEEWNTPIEGLGRINAGAGSSGELDPYLSVLAIPNLLWAAEDPLALTGARSFQDHCRWGMNAKEDYFLTSPDGDVVPRRSAAGASASHMQVIKRKIYYQAIAFPPLASPLNASASSVNGDNNNGSRGNNDDTASSRSTHSTMLGRLRRSNRKAALRPSVSVVASPRQGWIYLRFWLGTFLMRFMAAGSWLFGEKKPAPSSGAAGEGSSGGSHSASKTYSNVMTTAMTTIYRRLPVTPSLAASTANLPGDGDVVLQPMGYAPLVTQRYFVPLPVPILFMYGGEKRVMFHADHWCAYIRQYQRPRDGISDVVEVQGGGHWFFAEKKYQKKVADRIAEFLVAEQKSPLGL